MLKESFIFNLALLTILYSILKLLNKIL